MSNALLTAVNKVKFGVEEVLASDAQVYFENIFSTRHIGRVVDFMLFQCQPFIAASTDPAYTEYRFRHVIELAIFNAWANYRAGERSKVVELEFGWDKQRLVISASHIAETGVGGFVPGGEPANEVSKRMQKMLTQVQQLADGLIVRHDPKSGRVQAIAFLVVDEAEKLAAPAYLDLSLLPPPPSVEVEADTQVPEELSNGNLDAFLADENAVPAAAPEFIDDTVTLSGGGGEPDTTETVVKGSAPEDEFETRLSGDSAIEIDKTKIVVGGGAPAEDEVETRISGSAAIGVDKTKIVIGGGGPTGPNKDLMQVKRLEGGAAAAGGSSKREQLLMDKLKMMSEQITVLKAEKNNATASVSGPGSESSGEMGGGTRREQLLTDQKKVMSEQITALNEQINTMRSDRNEMQVALSDSNRTAAEALAKAASDDDKDSPEVAKLRKEIESPEIVPSNAKTWAKGLMESMTKERAELKVKAREIDSLLRRRDYEFKTKESGFVEQLRMMEGMIKQRESALEKSKETVANMSGIIEKMRAETVGNKDSAEWSHKLATAEKLLQAEKETSDRVQKRCEEIQKRLADEMGLRGAAQLDVVKFKKQADDLTRKVAQLQDAGQKNSSTDVLAVTDARDKAIRQVEQLKQQNRELQAKLSTSTTTTKSSANAKDGAKSSPAQSEAELKHKLDLADKLAKASKEELDKTKKRFEEVKLQENKLRGDLSKVQAELAKAQADLKAAGLRSAGAATAAAATSKGATKPKA